MQSYEKKVRLKKFIQFLNSIEEDRNHTTEKMISYLRYKTLSRCVTSVSYTKWRKLFIRSCGIKQIV